MARGGEDQHRSDETVEGGLEQAECVVGSPVEVVEHDDGRPASQLFEDGGYGAEQVGTGFGVVGRDAVLGEPGPQLRKQPDQTGGAVADPSEETGSASNALDSASARAPKARPSSARFVPQIVIAPGRCTVAHAMGQGGLADPRRTGQHDHLRSVPGDDPRPGLGHQR